MENPATAAGSMLPIPTTNTSSAIASKRRAELAVTELMGVAQKKVKSEGEGISPVMSITATAAASSDEVSIVVTTPASGGGGGGGGGGGTIVGERQQVRTVEIEKPLLILCLCNAVWWFVIAAAVLGVLLGTGSGMGSGSLVGSFVGTLCYALPVYFLILAWVNYFTGAMLASGTLSDKLRASHHLHRTRFRWILVFYLTPRLHLARRIMLHLARERQQHPNYLHPTLL